MSSVSVPEIKTDKGFLPRQTKLLLGAFVILGAIGFIVFNSLVGNQQYFMTLSEMKSKGNIAYQENIRIGGNLVPNTTKIDSQAVTAQFTLSDDQNDIVPVAYKGILPDTFEKSTQVIAEGKMGGDGTFHATLVLAKCPSKYDPSKIDWYSSSQPGNLNYSAAGQ